MRTTLLAVLLLFTTAAFAQERWIEFNPPMMDDVTVGPLRFTQQGAPFDLSDPMFRPIEHGQSAKATRSNQTTKDKLVIDYEFTGRGNLEYLEIQTNIKIDKPGFSLGGVFNTDLTKAGAVRMRLRDPSGEIHQHTLGHVSATQSRDVPLFATIETSPDGIWGGDGDKQLQFPCEVVSILLDKPEVGFTGKGTLGITDLALYEPVELRDALKIEFAADSPPGLLFEAPGTLKLRLTPKNLKEGETLYFGMFPDLRIADECRFDLDKIEDIAKIDLDKLFVYRLFINGICLREVRQELLYKEGRGGIEAFRDVMLQSTEVPQEGIIFEIPFVGQGAVRTVFSPVIKTGDSESHALPVAFSFGSIKPNMPQDDRLGVCTHYQQGWNTNSIDFAVKAGFGMIRDEMTWSNVERQKGVLAVPNYATYIDLACEKNLEPLLLLNYSNRFYDDNGFPASEEAIAGFANYSRFVAENFKGRIKYYEVWNEWFIACGMRHAENSGQNTPENYLKLLKATYEAVKSVDPDAYIIGGGGDHPVHHIRQMKALLELGALQYCDAFSIHPYRQPRTPEESGLVEEVLGFAELMKQNGMEEPKIWITEIGWPTPKKHPAKDAELFQAAMVVRSAVPLLALDCVEKYIWYDLKNDGTDRIDQEHNFGLIRHDRLGLQVKPAFVSFAVMSSNTAGRKIAKDETLSQDGVYAYRLTKSGEPDRLVLWVEHGEKRIVLPGISSATNMFGTPLQFTENIVTLTDEPIWAVR